MDLSKLPEFKLNDIILKPLFIIDEGAYGLTIALTTKENSTKYPLLICKIFKIYKLKSITLTNSNYKLLQKFNVVPQLLGIQILENNFTFECKNNNQTNNNICEFDKHIYYYELGGIMTLYFYLFYLFELRYENIHYLKLYIDNVIENIININKLGIIHGDLNLNNIMIKNNHTFYLSYAYHEYYYTNTKQKNIFISHLDKYLFSNISDILDDTHLINKSLNIKLHDNIISIIDWDLMININNYFKSKIKKYNINNNNVKQILSLIYLVYTKYDLITFYIDILSQLIIIKNKLTNKNINYIYKYIENKFNELIVDIISNNKILQNINNKQLSYHIIINIYYSYYIKRLTKHTFNSIFNYLYTKQYLKDNDYIYSNLSFKYNNILDICKYNKIKLLDKYKKNVYK